MAYSVVEAVGVKVRVISAHETRPLAVKAMEKVSGRIVVVTNPTGRIVASNVSRSV